MAKSLSPFSFFLLLLPLLLFLPQKSHSQTLTAVQLQEKQTLLRLKSYWGEPPSLASWSNTAAAANSSSHCGWNGITCTSGFVTNITLQHQDIHGDIPSFLCSTLTNLSVLNLFNNSVPYSFPSAALSACSNLLQLNLGQNLLVGLLPSDIAKKLSSKLRVLNLQANNFTGDIPLSIAQITSLQELYLDNNLFNGSFPVEIGSMPNLDTLTLASNPFPPTSLPAEFGNLQKLKYLWMSEDNLVGAVPETFANLTLLEHLDLAINNLNGTIPTGIWALNNLQEIFLYKNQLSGEIPAKIGAKGLVSIDISMNQLTGSIPADVGNLQKLEILFMYNNNFSGEIPAGIGKITTLKDIRLFRNNLTGTLPPDLGKYSALWNLEVCENQITGEIPPNLCAGQNLNSLVVFSNNLNGNVPQSLGDCSTLVNIQLYGNGFTGDMPKGIWTLTNLNTVIVRDNDLSGDLPDMLPWNLSRLELSNNRFSGNVPSMASRLQVFKASNNAFSGELPSTMTRISKLQELYLDGNRISGVIPSSIGSLTSLTNLNLSTNQLTGEIPAVIGSLPVLTSLDLSNNHFSGNIPAEIGNLKVNFLNLSSNSLTGEIPTPLENGAYDRSFLSNPGLCSTSSSVGLPSCSSKWRNPGDISKGLRVALLAIGVLVIVAGVVVGFLVVRDLKRRKDGSDLTRWKLTSFQSLNFTETSIVSGLTQNNLIGYGGSGQVYRIEIGHRTGEVVAVKKIWNSKKVDSKLEKEFEAEVEILGSIRHINIVKLLCCISSADSKMLVYEYMENGSLDQWLHGRRRRSSTTTEGLSMGLRRETSVLDWPTRLGIALGAAKGLCYMHHDCNPPIVHRDVKSSNILLDSEFKPKVADFGLARILVKAGEPETVTAVAGSFGYMAPECAYSKKVNQKVDVYSFGVVLLELTTGKQANDGGGDRSLAEWAWRHFQDGGSVMDAVDEEIRDTLWIEEMGMVMRLGLICTGTLPSTRPTMKDVLQVLLRCSRAHGFGDNDGKEYDDVDVAVMPLGKKGSRRRAPDEDDDGSGLLCNV